MIALQISLLFYQKEKVDDASSDITPGLQTVDLFNGCSPYGWI